MFNISLDVEPFVSFVPACTMIWPGFLWSNGMVWWFKSSTVAPGKFLTLTVRLPPLHNPSSKTPSMMESPTINAVLFDHWVMSEVIFSLEVLIVFKSAVSFFSFISNRSFVFRLSQFFLTLDYPFFAENLSDHYLYY